MKHALSIVTLVAFLLSQLGAQGVAAVSSIDAGVEKTVSQLFNSERTVTVALEQTGCCDPSLEPGVSDTPQCEMTCDFVHSSTFAFTPDARNEKVLELVKTTDEFSLTPTKHPPKTHPSI